MNIKKMFTTLSAMVVAVTMTMPSVSVFGATYTAELEGAYDWAHEKWITTMSSIDNANMYGNITRAEMAKMLSVYATEVLGYTADTSKACTFSDIDSVKGDLHDYIIESCQLGIMGQGITAFRPYDTLSRAEFGTALSRVLWADTYEGGTPYYAKHLDALKAAGIMNQIANAETTKEVRGYVMLMLQRSEENGAGVDCEDTDVVLACLEDLDNCPAACKADYEDEDNNTDEDGVVKSGNLVVTADSADDAKVFIGRASDLDVLTFKTSEEVEISKVVLERYGYSTAKNVAYVWLENEDGKVITNKATLDSKWQAKLTLKKDYKKVDGELNATIVLQTTAANDPTDPTRPGATFWFKVVDVTSTAKNVDLDNYKPATYEAIAYDGSALTLVSRTYAAKTYNFEADKMYEILKFKIQTPDDAAVIVKWFTLDNTAWSLDLNKFFNEAEVTIAGEPVSKLKAEANKSSELVLSFNDVEIPAKTKAEVVVKMSLTEDFDAFGNNVKLTLTDLSAIDAKVASRVAWNNTAAWNVTTYTFNGGKIKLTNNKLGNIDAAQNSEDIVIAEGNIEIPETIKGTFFIDVKGKAAGGVKDLTFVVNGDETDGVAYDLTTAPVATTTKAYNKNDLLQYKGTWANTGYFVALKDIATGTALPTTLGTDVANTWEFVTIPDTAATPTLLATDFVRYTFSNVEIDKSGKVKFLVDIKDAASWNSQTITLSNFGFDAFTSIKYDDSNKPVEEAEVSGTISFSKVTVQPSKASLKNNNTKEIEFANKETNRKVVFDGTYTSKRGDIKLNEFTLTHSGANHPSTKVTFYLIVDGEEVSDAKAVYNGVDGFVAADTFDNVLVEDGKSVSVVVEAEVEANEANLTNALDLGKYKLTIRWEDENGNTNSGKGDANTVSMKVVEKGSVTIPATTSSKTVLLKASDAVLAQFTVKPANDASEVDLESIAFKITGIAGATTSDPKVTVKVADIEEDDVTVSAWIHTYTMNRKVNSDGAVVTITIDDEVDTTVTLTNLEINGKSFSSRTFEKKFANALVYVANQNGGNGTTKLTLGVDTYDSTYSVSYLRLYVGNNVIDADGNLTAPTNGTKSAVTLTLTTPITTNITAWTEFVEWWNVANNYTANAATIDLIEVVAHKAYPATTAGDATCLSDFGASVASACSVTTAWTAATKYTIAGDFSNGDLVEAVESSTGVQMITQIDYEINGVPYSISKTAYGDYFKVNGDDYAKIFKAN